MPGCVFDTGGEPEALGIVLVIRIVIVVNFG